MRTMRETTSERLTELIERLRAASDDVVTEARRAAALWKGRHGLRLKPSDSVTKSEVALENVSVELTPEQVHAARELEREAQRHAV